MITVRKGANKVKCKNDKNKYPTQILDPDDILLSADKVEGAEIQLHKVIFNWDFNKILNIRWCTKVTRSEMGAYMCIARNGVPPAVSKTVQLNVNCKWDPSLASLISRVYRVCCITSDVEFNFQFSLRYRRLFSWSGQSGGQSKASPVWRRPRPNQ